jgi:hypothetical protein
MRVVASFILALTVAIGVVCVAVLAATDVRAQSPPTTLLNVYEQASLVRCQGTSACRLDFSTVQRNLKVLRVSCLIDVQSNAVNSLISDFELGNASADQTGYSFGQFLAPLQLLSTTSSDQFYIANVDALHVVPAGLRPSILIVSNLNPSTLIVAQCSISGSFLD